MPFCQRTVRPGQRTHCELEESLNMMAWIERVPSLSNVADYFSRQVVESFRGCRRFSTNLEVIWQKCESANVWTSLIQGEEHEAETETSIPKGQNKVRQQLYSLYPCLNSDTWTCACFAVFTSKRIKRNSTRWWSFVMFHFLKVRPVNHLINAKHAHHFEVDHCIFDWG